MRKMMIAAAVAATMTATPAVAQQTSGGLIAVNIGDVLSDNDVDVRVREVLSRLNTNVIAQVPIGLAANVCGISVAAARNLTTCNAETDITQGQARALANANGRSN